MGSMLLESGCAVRQPDGMTPPDVDAVRAHLAGLQERIGVALDAASVSLIVHPRNPYAPTIT